MANPSAESSTSDIRSRKGDPLVHSTPLLMATALPPETSYLTVTIDDEPEIPQESTPLIAVYSNNEELDHLATATTDPGGVTDAGPTTDTSASSSAAFFRDWFFAILFCGQLLVLLYFGTYDSPKGYEVISGVANMTFIRQQIIENTDDITDEQIQDFDTFVSFLGDYVDVYPERVLWWNIVPAAIFAFASSHIVLVTIIKPFSKLVVSSTLISTVLVTFLVGTGLFLLSPGFPTLLIAVLVAMAVVYYVSLVWPMVDFAAVNLKVALSGINANAGVYILAFFSCELAIIYAAFWFYTAIGLLSYINDECGQDADYIPHDARFLKSGGNGTLHLDAKVDGADDDADTSCGQGWYILFLILSFYWTNKVLMNTVEVTVAGVMATWCFDKAAARGCCSGAVGSSLYRSMTYSFGSICLGSLLQGIVKVLRRIIPDPRSRRGGEQCCGLCFCVTECFGRVLEDVLDYFNQWAFTFVGIYGVTYIEGGKRVMELFVSKGWTSIISERLASYVMSCVTLAVGVLGGLFTLAVTAIIDSQHSDELGASGDSPDTFPIKSYVYGQVPPQVSFFIGFIVGAVVCAVNMSVVRGAVNTMIVCFADSPLQIEQNHPELIQEVVTAWSDAFPETISKHSFEPPTAEPVAVTIY